MSNIISDITITIYAAKDRVIKDNAYKIRAEVLSDLNIEDKGPKGEDNFWLFYETYTFPKEKYDDLSPIIKKYNGLSNTVEVNADYFCEFEEFGTIELSEKVRVSDPCYDMDTWCAGTIENVLPGKYHCFYQKTGEGRVAAISVIHDDIDRADFEIVEGLDVGVDSGTCGIYDLNYFEENCSDENWYDSIGTSIRSNDCTIMDNKAFVSYTGYGDGSYDCLVAYNKDHKIAAIMIQYINTYED